MIIDAKDLKWKKIKVFDDSTEMKKYKDKYFPLDLETARNLDIKLFGEKND